MAQQAITEERPKEAPARAVGGLWPWFLQRMTAALLIVFLGAHWGTLHFVLAGRSITFDRVSERLATPLFVFIDSALLALVIYHGLNGISIIVGDFAIGPRAKRAVDWALIIIGLGTFVYGLNALWPFMTGGRLF